MLSITCYMLLILDGNPEIGAHVGQSLFYVICLRHLLRSGQKNNFLSTHAQCVLERKKYLIFNGFNGAYLRKN